MRSESALAGLHTLTKSQPDFAQQIFRTYNVRIAICQKLILYQISLLQHLCSRNPVVVKNFWFPADFQHQREKCIRLAFYAFCPFCRSFLDLAKFNGGANFFFFNFLGKKTLVKLCFLGKAMCVNEKQWIAVE